MNIFAQLTKIEVGAIDALVTVADDPLTTVIADCKVSDHRVLVGGVVHL